MKSPKRPKPTAEQKALEKRQQIALDKEIEETEEKLSLFSRRTLGTASLLSGAPKSAKEAAGSARATSSVSSPASLMSGSGIGATGRQTSPRAVRR